MSRVLNMVTVFAPAKINLSLHVVGQRADGYHLLDSLVVFASVGDVLHVQLGNTLSVTTQGPEAAGVPSDMNNLILKVATLFNDMPSASFLLEKNLPVASGIGGGSADAAAAFRGLMTHWSDGVIDPKLYDPSHTPFAARLLALGADIPVCLQSVPTRMSGVGEVLDPVPDVPLLYAVLVNPRVGVSTPEVFKALKSKDNAPMPGQIPGFAGPHEFITWLGEQRNDLQAPACNITPDIATTLSVLEADPGCLLARMSGSGATCFGLYADRDTAEGAAQRIAADQPGWWVTAVTLGSMAQASLPRFTKSG